MKKLWLALVLGLAGVAHAGEVKVEFGFFSSAKDKGEIFKNALPTKTSVRVLDIDGQRLDLGDEWLTAYSGYTLGKIKVVGDEIEGRGIARGQLLLTREAKAGQEEFMMLELSLNKRTSSEYFNSSPDFCKPAAGQLLREVSAPDANRYSCVVIQEGKNALPERAADRDALLSIQRWLRERQLFPKDAKLLELLTFESRNANMVHIYRARVANDGGLDEMRDAALRLRQEVQQNFL